MKKMNLKKHAINLLAGSLIFISAGVPGYDHNGNDIDECQDNPCPPAYFCRNVPGSYFCLHIDENGDVVAEEGGNTVAANYILHDGFCTFEGIVDSTGGITLYGFRKQTSLVPGAPYHVMFKNATRECEYGGMFSCNTFSCEKFWKEVTDVNPAF